MDAKRLSRMMHRTRRRVPDPEPSPHMLDLTVQAIRATHTTGAIHNEREFGTGEKLWVHLCAGSRVEFAAPAEGGFPAQSVVLHQREFEAMVSWIRAEFEVIAKAKHAQPAKFLN
jgi:hypothetical protein